MTFFMFVGAFALFWYLTGLADRRSGFLAQFARLLDRPEIRRGFANYLAGRSYLVGAFQGRKVRILLKRPTDQGDGACLVVSMETSFPRPLKNYDFEEHARDREGELAIFALKVTHDLRLALQEGCIEARMVARPFRFLPGRFDPGKWGTVLEQMHALARSLERRGV